MTQRELRAKQDAALEKNCVRVREHCVRVSHPLEVAEELRDTQFPPIYSLLRAYYFTFCVKQNMKVGLNALEDLKGMLFNSINYR